MKCYDAMKVATDEINKELADATEISSARIKKILAMLPLAKQIEEVLIDNSPDEMQLSSGGYIDSISATGYHVYSNLHIYFNNRNSIGDVHKVLEALDTAGIISVDQVTSTDIPTTMTRQFHMDSLDEKPISIIINWQITEANTSGCFKKLVRVKQQINTYEENVFELICPDPVTTVSEQA